MSFAENLQYLRKREKITQEELAEELDVSRQSVSKWETGEAFPETEKLIILCDRFAVNMDDLVRGDIAQAPTNEQKNEAENTQEEWKVCEDDIGFSKHMDKFSLRISAGVFMILMGVAVLLSCIAVGEMLDKHDANLVGSLGLLGLFLPVGGAVFLFIISGINHSEFVKAHGEAKNYFTKEQCAAFNKKFAVGIAVSVSLIILAVTGLAVTYTVLDYLAFPSKPVKDFADTMIVAAFMFVLAVRVGALCWLGIQHSKYDAAEYNRTNLKQYAKSKRERLTGGIQTAIMLTATAVFLLLGFVWNLWHPGWVVFPIAALVGAVVNGLIGINK